MNTFLTVISAIGIVLLIILIVVIPFQVGWITIENTQSKHPILDSFMLFVRQCLYKIFRLDKPVNNFSPDEIPTSCSLQEK